MSALHLCGEPHCICIAVDDACTASVAQYNRHSSVAAAACSYSKCTGRMHSCHDFTCSDGPLGAQPLLHYSFLTSSACSFG
jgi:hypothetical protein